MAEQYAGHTKGVSQQGGNAARGVLKTDGVQAVKSNLRVSTFASIFYVARC
jgi:hypothetical protein